MTNYIERLPVNKTVVFNTPIEGDSVLTRTGIIDDTSTLLHCINHACEDRYKHYSNEEKKDKIYRLKYRLLDKYLDIWKLSDISNKAVLKQIKTYLEKVQSQIHNDELKSDSVKKIIEDSKYIEHYKLLFELIKYNDYIRMLNSIKIKNAKSVQYIRDILLDELKVYYNNIVYIKSLDEKRKLFFEDLLEKMMKNIIDISIDVCSKSYFKNLATDKTTISSIDLKILSDFFDVNIYFINSKTKLPYIFLKKDLQSFKKKSIVLLSIDNDFEIIGRLLEGNEIERKFNGDDTIIHKIHNFIYNHDKIKKIYPELLKYLKNSKYEDSDNESENDIDDTNMDNKIKNEKNSKLKDKAQNYDSFSRIDKDEKDLKLKNSLQNIVNKAHKYDSLTRRINEHKYDEKDLKPKDSLSRHVDKRKIIDSLTQ